MGDYPVAEDVGDILFSEKEIADRVVEMGAVIAAEVGVDPKGRPPLLVGVLKGSVIFVADLVRAITAPIEIDFLAVSSYGQATQSSGAVKILKDLDHDIAGRNVILVEDIIDSGLTLRFLCKHLLAQQPASLKTCAMLVREGVREPDLTIDYVGFRIPPAFVIGYGLDVAQRYRNLRYIATYRSRE